MILSAYLCLVDETNQIFKNAHSLLNIYIALHLPDTIPEPVLPRLAGKFLALSKAPLTPLMSARKLAIASSSPLLIPTEGPAVFSRPGVLYTPYAVTGL